MSAPMPAASRRHFLLRGAAAAGGLVVALAPAPVAAAATAPARPATGLPDWIARLRGDERYLLDAPTMSDGRVLSLIRHFIDTSTTSYGLREDQVGVAGAFYSGTTFLALDDSAWQRYRLGEFLDPAQTSAGNPWRAAPVLGGAPAPSASIEALHRRGAVFIVCRAALAARARQVASRHGLVADEVQADLEARILPEVILVPSVIVEIQRAQRRGVAYYRVG